MATPLVDLDHRAGDLVHAHGRRIDGRPRGRRLARVVDRVLAADTDPGGARAGDLDVRRVLVDRRTGRDGDVHAFQRDGAVTVQGQAAGAHFQLDLRGRGDVDVRPLGGDDDLV